MILESGIRSFRSDSFTSSEPGDSHGLGFDAPAGSSMNRNTMRRLGVHSLTTWGLILSAVGLPGCGQSPEVKEIPEAARTSVLQKKVDVQPRPSNASKPGQGLPKGRSAGH
jgi:hypothetical protein